jgi:UDP-GlcNAc:undecaprenyl-phosphate GlcNAc-1-phosphate transferase
MALGLIGLWDDVRNLHPFPRFIGQTLAGVAVALLLIVNNNQGNPTNFPLLDVFITILWIVGICNSINFFDNLDGGAAGTVAVSTTTLAYLAVNNNQSLIGALSFVVAGSTLGFLVWNRSPARIYMGDAGSLFLGILLATLTLRFDPDTETSLASFATPILLLAIPILDTTVAVVSRLLRNVSPFKGGKDHLSHRLIRAGLTRKHSAILLWLLSAFFCLLAILFTLLNSYYEIVIIIFASILWALLFFGFVLTADY